ncbi:unnamed protein product, partial [marine sediment metagenome]
FSTLGPQVIKSLFKTVKERLGKIKNFPIQGKKIYLKKLTQANATKDYCNWLSDIKVNKYIRTKKGTIKSLREYILEKNKNPNCLFLGIFTRNTDKHIGNVKLEPIDWKSKKAGFGIMIGDKNYWGKRMAQEAVRLITEYAF